MNAIKSFFSFLLILVFVSSTSIFAHPSWGIVVDDNGCIYFADVMHNGDGTLWRLDPNTESLEAVFKKFHAHQIYINNKSEIFAGIAIWRSGEIEGEGHNYLFKYETNTKTLDTLLFTDDWDEYHGQNFALSNDYKNIYFSMNKQIHVKPLDGKTQPLLNKKFDRINTLTTDAQGNLWITDSRQNNGTLFKWNNHEGLVEVCNNLMPQNPKNPIFEERNHQLFYGIAFSHDQKPLITENANRYITKINNNGVPDIVYKSELFWHPTGVYFKNGNYYIMEVGYNKTHLGPRIVITDKNFKIKTVYEIDFDSKKLNRS